MTDTMINQIHSQINIMTSTLENSEARIMESFNDNMGIAIQIVQGQLNHFFASIMIDDTLIVELKPVNTVVQHLIFA